MAVRWLRQRLFYPSSFGSISISESRCADRHENFNFQQQTKHTRYEIAEWKRRLLSMMRQKPVYLSGRINRKPVQVCVCWSVFPTIESNCSLSIGRQTREIFSFYDYNRYKRPPRWLTDTLFIRRWSRERPDHVDVPTNVICDGCS